MKKSILTIKEVACKRAKNALSAALITLLGMITACGGDEPEMVAVGNLEVKIEGKIDHATFTTGQTGSVTFNRFPASVAEFKKVQAQIGGEPHGAVALELMAIEMYRRNATAGTECLKLCNTTINVNVQTSRLKELFGNDAYYARPYQVAAFLKGATPENSYTPVEPYVIEVKVNDGRPYQKITDYQSTELYLEALTKGKDHGSETLYVVKPEKCTMYPNGSDYFLVNNCPGLYAQVKEIYAGNWKGLK
jgi:hypothetical protein